MNEILLDALGLGAILSSILVITSRNPVISVLFLIAVFVNIAGYLVLLGVAYLGLVYLIVYVGAIAILFLFVIMMLNLRLVELIDTGKNYTRNLPMGALLGFIFLFEFISIIPILTLEENVLLSSFNIFNNNDFNSNSMIMEENTTPNLYITFNLNSYENYITSFTQIESIGQGLYTYASIWLILASILFLLAMIGPIVLCLNIKR